MAIIFIFTILFSVVVWTVYRQEKATKREYIYLPIFTELVKLSIQNPYLLVSFNNKNEDPVQIEKFLKSYAFKKLQKNGYKDISFNDFSSDIEMLPSVKNKLSYLKFLYITLGLPATKNLKNLKNW